MNYFELVREFPLRPIKSEVELDQAIERVNTVGKGDYRDVLFILIDQYKKPVQMKLRGIDLLKQKMTEMNVSQTQVARGACIGGSTLSNILSGQRKLSIKHINKLAAYFNIYPGELL